MTLTCSAWARRLAEPLAGTTPEARGWLLVELPGPWGRDAAADHRLGPVVTDVVDLPEGVRFQAIRRPDRLEPPSLRVVLANSGPRPWAVAGELTELAHLAEVPVGAALDERPPEWGTPVDVPLYLVCTHARRDRCCATFGRPIFDALTEVRGEAVWETSHTGGHRFAANLLVLPDGLLYGGLTPFDVAHVMEAYEDGDLSLPHLRGRSRFPRIAQAAEVALRHELDLTAIDALELVAVDGGAVTFRADGAVHVVTMREEILEPHPVSCGADPTEPTAWQVVAISPSAAPA